MDYEALMKPSYYFRNVKFLNYTKSENEVMRLWNKVKNKDCVALVVLTPYSKFKIVIVLYNGKILSFYRAGFRIGLNSHTEDIKTYMNYKQIYKNDDLLLINDI